MQSWKQQEGKNMVVLIDTNVIIDFLVAREPFYDSALHVMEKCASGEAEGYMAFQKAVMKAIKMDNFKDFEDCLQDRCAEEVSANYIITRNTADFEASVVSAIEPDEWLKKLN